MPERNKDASLRLARWAVVGAFGLVALLMGTVAFAGVAFPGQAATYVDLPVVHVASKTATLAPLSTQAVSGSMVSRPAQATQTASGGPATGPAGPAGSHPDGSSSVAPTAGKTPVRGAATLPKGNTTDRKPAGDRKREVVAPDVRVDESGGHGGEGGGTGN